GKIAGSVVLARDRANEPRPASECRRAQSLIAPPGACRHRWWWPAPRYRPPVRRSAPTCAGPGCRPRAAPPACRCLAGESQLVRRDISKFEPRRERREAIELIFPQIGGSGKYCCAAAGRQVAIADCKL